MERFFDSAWANLAGLASPNPGYCCHHQTPSSAMTAAASTSTMLRLCQSGRAGTVNLPTAAPSPNTRNTRAGRVIF